VGEFYLDKKNGNGTLKIPSKKQVFKEVWDKGLLI